jgi:hypothetical protein
MISLFTGYSLLRASKHLIRTGFRPNSAIRSFHPWYYHEISLANPPPPKEDHYRALFLSKDSGPKRDEEFQTLLPALSEPKALDEILASVKSNLLAHPRAMLGEVGLDRSFRIAYQPYPAPPPRKLSSFSTPISHQLAILEAQLSLAVELKRNISIHSVAAQQVTLDLLQRMKEQHGAAWRAISIDMHSCGLSLEGWKSLEVRVDLINRLTRSEKARFRKPTVTSSCHCQRPSTAGRRIMCNSLETVQKTGSSQNLTMDK